MNLVSTLKSFGIILEMNDWKKHFLAGTKGQPKTDVETLDFVEKLLKDSFENNTQKVNNCKLAPWVVKIVKEIGFNDISEIQLEKLKTILQWFNITGSEGNISKLTLDQAFESAKKSLDKIKSKESQNKTSEETETSTEDIVDHLNDEKRRLIKRIFQVNDGSNRLWVEVLDNYWLSELSEFNDPYTERYWGVKCQATDFLGNAYQNFQLIGPPAGNKNGPWSTQVGMGGSKSNHNLTEIKQEGNHHPGSQSTSAGYSDGDERIIDFLCFSAVAKEKIKYFANYQGNVPVRDTNETYGAEVFLKRIIKVSPELFNKLCTYRNDIIETNKDFIISLKGQEWYDERSVDIAFIAKENPIEFLSNLSRYLDRFGKDAAAELNKIDIEGLYLTNPDVIFSNINLFIASLPKERFEGLLNKIDLKLYTNRFPEESKKLFKSMSHFPQYQDMFNKIIESDPQELIKSFGNGNTGVMNFLKFASSPKDPKHQNAVLDKSTGEYIGTRKKIVVDSNGERRELEEKFTIDDNLKVLNQKKRRDFLIKNKELIKSYVKGTEEDKEINFLKLYASELNPQEIDRLPEKEFMLDYYDKKYQAYFKDKQNMEHNAFVQKYAVKNSLGNYVTDSEGEIVLKKYRPGIMEIMSFLQLKNKGELKISLADGKKYLPQIFKYFENESPETNDLRKKIDGLVNYLKLMKNSGMSLEEIFKIQDNFISKFLSSNNTVTEAHYLGRKFFEYLDYDLAWKQIEKLRTTLEAMGEKGIIGYRDLVNKLSLNRYKVSPGDIIMFKGNINDKEDYYYLKKGKGYKVLQTKDEIDEQGNTIMNGYVLISDENGPNGIGQDVWLKTSRFDVYKDKYSPISMFENFNAFEKQFIKIKTILNEQDASKKISYSAIILDDNSVIALKALINDLIKKGIINSDWKISAHHATINMGPIYDKDLLGKTVNFKATELAYNEKVCAVKVQVDDPIIFSNKIPHVTLGFDQLNGAKPVMSNHLTDWKIIKNINLSGQIKEI